METDYRTLSNKELKEKLAELESEFNDSKYIIKQAYERMSELSAEYGVVSAVLKERNVPYAEN